MSSPEKIRPYEDHGLILSPKGKEWMTDCPFCQKENHFFVRESTGQFNCRRCGEEGNIPSFLQKVHASSLEATSSKDYMLISKDRGIPVSELKAWGLAKSFINDQWLLPGYNTKGAMANLYRIIQDEKGKWRAYSTTGCNMHPFGTSLVSKNTKTLWVCEGPWDAMKLRWMLGVVGVSKADVDPTTLADTIKSISKTGSLLAHHSVIAVPGASTFSPEWAHYINHRNTYLVYDNDHPKKIRNSTRVSKPGWDGMKRAVSVLGEAGASPRTLYRVRWGTKGHDPSLPDGYDVRDILSDHGVDGLKLLLRLLEPVDLQSLTLTGGEETTVEPLERTSFAELSEDFKQALHFSPMMRDSLAVALAVVFSTTVKTDAQLWIRIIGPPGSGKTTIAECLSADKEHTFARSIIRGFHSGHAAGPKKNGKAKDASLINKLRDKTMVIKDADTLVTNPNCDLILGELRDLYDGVSRNEYRNLQNHTYENIQASFILCGTDELRKLNRSAAGDRFLDCEILGDESTDPFVESAFNNTFASAAQSFLPEKTEGEETHEVHGEKLVKLKRATVGFIRYLKSQLGKIAIPTYDETAKQRIKALGHFIANMRARVSRDNKADLAYRPRAELPTRLTSQLAKLAISLAIVLGKSHIDKEILRILTKIAWDTSEGFQKEACELLAKYPNGLSARQITIELSLADSSVRKLLADMAELKLITRRQKPNRSGIGGRDLHLWVLRDEIISMYRTAQGPRLKPKPKKV